MFKNFRDKIAFSGITVLSIGIALLICTFISAYGFLSEGLQILSTQDLVQAFGETLGPLIATSIRVMYLGVMGWIGSLITIRGVTIIANTPKTESGEPEKTQEAKEKAQPLQETKETQKPKEPEAKPQEPQPQPTPAKEEEKETKPEVKPAEPELIAIPLEEMEQQPQQQSNSASK
jgi:type IV secretory pathway VirB10-like protein